MKGLYYLARRGEATPEEADLCVTICDDCMAPYVSEGDTVYVSCTEPVEELEVALFFFRGKVLCRQWCEDFSGTLHLLPANPAFRDRCIAIPKALRDRCLCLGSVLFDRKLPRPSYR